jgi:hypothetical protein
MFFSRALRKLVNRNYDLKKKRKEKEKKRKEKEKKSLFF